MKTDEMSFQVSLENCQEKNVLHSDFVPLCDGTTRRRLHVGLRLLKGM